MSKLRNRGTIPQGMLAPSGLEEHPVDPAVQSTTRPAGTLLQPSPGYDTVRRGKNVFQGRGPTGGFRQMEYAEDVGGSGAAIAVRPGDTSSIPGSEWLPEGEDSLPEGSLIIADRNTSPGHAHRLHEAHQTIPDMGDRHPSRPLSKLLVNPTSAFREEYRENKVLAVIAAAGVVTLAWIVGNDLEREYRSRRGRGVVSEATAVPASGAATSGDELDKATENVTGAADKAIEAIDKAAKDAVEAVSDAGKTATDSIRSAASATE